MNLKKLSYVFFTLALWLLASCSSGVTSSAKDITAFSFPEGTGVITDTSATEGSIAVTVPSGTVVTGLVATFTATGSPVAVGVTPQVSGVTSNDFTGAVYYIVTAADSTTKAYKVTVTVSITPPTPGRAAGTKETFSADGVSFTMVSVPGGLSFPVGVMDITTPKATVDRGYWIGETEVTWELWSTVYTWATANGYHFADVGASGSGLLTQPVAQINWRDTMIFSNALTEWYNTKAGTSYTCVYYTDAAYTTPIRTSTNNAVPFPLIPPGSEDNPYVKMDATGFRLLTSNEWELAAKYKDGTNWTPGNYASGATDHAVDWSWIINPDETATEAVAWYSGTNPLVTPAGSQAVKLLSANALGLYDMSGNVCELTYDWFTHSGACRVCRGGNWSNDAGIMQVGGVFNCVPPVLLFLTLSASA